MVMPYLDSPRSEANDTSRLIDGTSLHLPADEPSFHSPKKSRDPNYPHASRDAGLRTPNAGNLLDRFRQSPSKGRPEFTPLLKSAARNRQRQHQLQQPRPKYPYRQQEQQQQQQQQQQQHQTRAHRADGDRGNGPVTPVAGRRRSGIGFAKAESPGLPEPSTFSVDISSSTAADINRTPVIPVASSVICSPVAVPDWTGNGAPSGRNILSLREQEARIEEIDKENFGLKLRIHFLEENLKKTGTEFNRDAIKENTELKVDRITLQRDLKQYRKSLGNAEHELEQYRIQLRDYTQKVKERHVAESVREEMDDLRSQLQEKDALIAALHQDREDENGAAVANGEVERLQDDIGDLEADIREREGIIQGKDEELDALHERVQALESEQAGDDDRQTVEEQQEELEALRDEVEAATLARNEEIAKLREDLRASERARVEELNSVKKSKELEIEKSRNELGKFRQEHDDEIAALEDRLRIAESGGNNRVQLLQQALDDAREDTKRVRRDKDGEIHELHSKLQSAQTIKEEMEQYKRQSSSHQEELNRRKKDEATSEGERRSLLNDNQRQTQEIQSLKQRVNDLERDLQDAENVRRRLQQKEHELSPLRRTAEERRVALQELSSLQEVIREQTGELKRLRVTADERSKLQAEVEQLRSKLRRCESELELLQKVADEPDSQLEIVQKVVNDRNTEVDGLRDKIEKLKRLVEEVQKTANNRLQSMNDLKKEIDKNKTLHEEEIQVLDMALEDMQEEKDQLQKQVKSMAGRAKEQDAGRGVSQSLQKQISELRVENLTLESESQKAADRLSAMEADKSFFSSKVQQLTDQLDKARLVARSKQVSGQGLQELQDMVKNSELEAENLRVELAKKEQQVAEEIKVRRTNRREESEARDKMADAEKRHAGELRGLAKQIQYLKAKCVREEGLREALAYSKQYFLMQIELYNECNKVDLRLIGEMGISASRWQPRRKPSLRVVGFLVLASVRVRRLQKEWATNVKLHSALQRKYEQVRHQSRLTRQK